MDPDVTWDEILSRLDQLVVVGAHGFIAMADQIHERALGLDMWLQSDGFMPKQAEAAGISRRALIQLCKALQNRFEG